MSQSTTNDLARYVSTRLAGIESSGIIRMRRECERLGAINLASGTCELPPPVELQDAAAAAIRSGPNIYSLPEGVAELRHAIAAKLARDNALTVDPDAEVTITAGATGAYFAALLALVNPGDEVILFEPVYSWHRDAARMAGVTPRLVHLEPPAFRLDPDRLRAAIRPTTRAIVVCTPGNPSGRVLDEDELAGIAAVAREHDLLVLSDEVYEYLVYDGRRHVSPASLAQLADRTVSIMSLSKTFNVTGWRLGYVVARPELTRALRVAHDLMVTCAPTPLQHAAVAALRMPPSYHDGLRRSFQGKRDRLVDALHAAGLEPQSPQGAYYVLASYDKLGTEVPAEAAFELLRRALVASVPGTTFCEPGRDRFLRFCFARDDAELDEACRRLRRL